MRDVEKAGILAKISGNVWATSVYNGMISRMAADVASHQSNPDTFIRGLPVDWTLTPAKFKTIPAFSESSVRYPAEAKFNLLNIYPNLPLSLPRISYLRYPNGEQITFGDGSRPAGGQLFADYELVYQHALAPPSQTTPVSPS